MALLFRAARMFAVATAPARTAALSTAALAPAADGAQKQVAKKRRTVINKIIAGTYVPRVEEFHPQLVNGKWNKPKRSARMRAKMKKTMTVHGIEGWRAEFEPTPVRDAKWRTRVWLPVWPYYVAGRAFFRCGLTCANVGD
jgi:hypothetical protein